MVRARVDECLGVGSRPHRLAVELCDHVESSEARRLRGAVLADVEHERTWLGLGLGLG